MPADGPSFYYVDQGHSEQDAKRRSGDLSGIRGAVGELDPTPMLRALWGWLAANGIDAGDVVEGTQIVTGNTWVRVMVFVRDERGFILPGPDGRVGRRELVMPLRVPWPELLQYEHHRQVADGPPAGGEEVPGPVPRRSAWFMAFEGSVWSLLVSVVYQVRARALHRFGRHTYRLRWFGLSPRFSNRCTWCGQLRAPVGKGR